MGPVVSLLSHVCGWWHSNHLARVGVEGTRCFVFRWSVKCKMPIVDPLVFLMVSLVGRVLYMFFLPGHILYY